MGRRGGEGSVRRVDDICIVERQTNGWVESDG